MSTCTDLINAINAVVVDPNLVVDLSGNSIAVLSNIGTTETAFSLSGGGVATLSVPSSPSIDGIPCRLTIAGKVHTVSGSPGLGLYLGSSATLASDTQIFAAGSQGEATDTNFIWSASFVWDSTSQNLNFSSSSIDTLGVANDGTSPSNVTGITGQTSIKFIVSGKFSVSNASNSITLTRFHLESLV